MVRGLGVIEAISVGVITFKSNSLHIRLCFEEMLCTLLQLHTT